MVNSKAARAPDKIVLGESQGGEAGKEQPPVHKCTLSNLSSALQIQWWENGMETSERLVLLDSCKHARKVANSPVRTHLILYLI